MGGLRALTILQLIYISACNDQLDIVYQWNQLDYQFPTPEDRQLALDNQTFIPENNIPMGLEVYGDKLFITVPRWKSGVPASLNYVDLNDNSTNSPNLIPYPNWEAHSFDDGPPEIISPFRVRADRCSRLWILDNGKIGNLDDDKNFTRYPPALIIYNLKTDTLIRKYEFPSDQVKEESGFANIVIEDTDCQNTFAYVGDLGKAAIIVYSWDKHESWRITHHYFNLDPNSCEFNVNGLNFTWTDAIFGMGISSPNSFNFSTLYFHPMASSNEFAVSTEYLRNKTLADNNFGAFMLLGNRGSNAQSSVSFVDQKTGVLFYSLVNLNAVACWRTSNKVYDMKNQGRIFMSNETMVYPTDIKVDYNDNLWVLSNRLPMWMYKGLDPNEVNFRVFSAPVLEAISHTACDVTPRSDILDKYMKNMNITIIDLNITTSTSKPNEPSSGFGLVSWSYFYIVLVSSFVSLSF